MEKTQQKKIYIEFIRIIASFFVIFNHTRERGFFLFASYPENSIQYWLYMFLSVFCKFSVPMFFAISGALLLSKDETIKELYKKRILKMVIALLIFSFLYYLRSILDNLGAFSLKHFIEEFLISNWNFTFWYLYAFIPFLMSLPFLRVLAKNMKTEQFHYLFVCALFFKAVIPVMEYLIWQGNETFNSNIRTLWITTDVFLYPLLGYYLEHKVDILKAKKWIIPLWGINIFTIIITCLLTYYRINITSVCEENASQVFYGCFTLINITTIYISVKYYFETHSPKEPTKKLIGSLGGVSFGIYLVHLLFLNLFPVVPRVWRILEGVLGANSMLSALIVCVIVMVMSYFTTLIMKKLPILRKLV